jgi:hypothetical protein
MATQQQVSVKDKGLDLQMFIRRAADTHARLLETADHLASVIEDAKTLVPLGVLGTVAPCRGCGESYPERRRTDALEYGFCSYRCYRAANP